MPIDAGEYCREIETYLCRKNDGHLIRIVGPAFERVCQWAASGVPLAIAFRGIDRTFERYYRKQQPRRRPVRVEFCEDEVLDAFDEWRRAVGVAGPVEAPARQESLPTHLSRVAERLSSLVAGSPLAPRLNETIGRTLGEIGSLADRARGLRGPSRAAALERLRELDSDLIAAARESATETELAELARAAEVELAPFAARMPADAFARAVASARDHLLRDRLGLPTLAME